MAQSKKIDEPQPVTDMVPVELDPPAPEIVRWQELTDRNINICHAGDASLVLPTPRPAWADPDGDVVESQPSQSAYRSAPALVALSCERGLDFDKENTLKPARLVVRAFSGHLLDQDFSGIELRLVRAVKGKTEHDEKPWNHTQMSLSVSEARKLVKVLLAAADLVEGEK